MINIPPHILAKCQNIKLIFFDIDGTLLNTHGQWSYTLPQQLTRLHKSGIKLAIASGRPSFAAKFIFDVLPIRHAGAFCTGAELVDPSKNQTIQTHFLPTERVQLLYERANHLGIYTEFYTSSAFFVPELTNVTHIHAEHLRVKPVSVGIEALFSQEKSFTKLLLGNDERVAPRRLENLAEQFPDMEFAFANFLACPGWRFASVINQTASKEKAFQTLLEYHNVNADEVAAFGDSHSDEVFISMAGLGVAMGNANDVLKQKADFITDTVDHHGVEQVLAYIATD